MGMNLPPQFPIYVPVPTAPIPSQVVSPKKGKSRPRKDDNKSKKNRDPKDLPHKIKRSKRSKSPARRRDDSTSAPTRSPSPSQLVLPELQILRGQGVGLQLTSALSLGEALMTTVEKKRGSSWKMIVMMPEHHGDIPPQILNLKGLNCQMTHLHKLIVALLLVCVRPLLK